MKPERLLLLLIPWGLSLTFSTLPVISYFIAWLGSFFIFYVSIKGLIKPIPTDLKVSEQLMRPLFLPHIIFAGYMCSTSIFYFFSVLGVDNFSAPAPNYFIDLNELERVAQCQRYYCLAHAVYVAGILLHMNYDQKKRYYLNIKDSASFMLLSAVFLIPFSAIFQYIGALRQFYFQFQSLSFMAGTLALAFAIPQKKPGNTLLAGLLFLLNVSQALLSGFKEPIILSFLILGVFLYPFYKKLVMVTFIPFLLLLFILLPTYAQVFRANAWSDEKSAEDASDLAINAVLNQSSEETDETNWGFLTNRLSEMGMFTIYANNIPSQKDYYGFELVKQALSVIIPRVFWPDKPSTEELIMERVYDAGVVQRGSSVSAKPQLVVDAFLSGGNIGIIIILFMYGSIVQLISVKAEKLFGGYVIGTALIFLGLSLPVIRGNSLEFLSNTMFWSYISMLVIFWSLRYFNIIRKI